LHEASPGVWEGCVTVRTSTESSSLEEVDDATQGAPTTL
jgi:hypothetical protein